MVSQASQSDKDDSGTEQVPQHVNPFYPDTISIDPVADGDTGPELDLEDTSGDTGPDLSLKKEETSAPQQEKTNQVACGVCGEKNRPGLLACENCGSLLTENSKSRQATRDLLKEGGNLKETTGEVEATEEHLKTSEYKAGMALHLYIEDADTPLVISPQQLKSQVLIGRHDPITQQSPLVDLDKHAAYRQGVSRKHCSLQVINEQLMANDLGSANGTFLNGIRLPMRKPQVIVAGDELRLGQVTIVVQFSQVN